MFAGVVPAAHGQVGAPAHGRHIDDAAPPGGPHCRQQPLGELGQAEHIDLELAARLRNRDLFHRAVAAVASVVDQQIHRTEVRLNAAGHCLDLGRFGEIEGESAHPLGGEGLQALLATGGSHDAVAGLVQATGGGRTDARRRAGDERHGGGRGRRGPHSGRSFPSRRSRAPLTACMV